MMISTHAVHLRPHFQVRKAVSGDAPSIARMIKGLAEYLGETDSIRLGEKELLRDGFGDQPLFHSVVAEEARCPFQGVSTRRRGGVQPKITEVLGAAIYYFTYSTWDGPTLHVEDIFVIPNARGQGVGTSLMAAMAKIAKERNCSRMQWLSPRKRPSCKFYEKLGAKCLSDWAVFRMDEREIDDLASKAHMADGDELTT